MGATSYNKQIFLRNFRNSSWTIEYNYEKYGSVFLLSDSCGVVRNDIGVKEKIVARITQRFFQHPENSCGEACHFKTSDTSFFEPPG